MKGVSIQHRMECNLIGSCVVVCHDPQRNRDTVEFLSRKRNKSNPGIKTLLPFPKNITEESDFENFQDLIVALDAY